ncbi:holo-ACP synthase [Candidatus Chlamydia sanziniae]|uniref:Holo-[acyl-carrier-protein] synthase n=1 Tax=Candidatus Chlamydia sanziniae TaxID=1806891 RepID=A0A1A9HYQ0_9CHLA|nr:holo-ACP synthase [Candidatus Chlamydia sanziniae]ANH79056.1 Holo-[acyl-carrier protein] synthase [Candidatus Chlamydia sanziniae]
MEIVYTGIDIIEISRIQKVIKTHGQRILNRLFTPKEQQYCLELTNPISSFAGRFAAKEAIAKALGTGIGRFIGWKDIEILKTSQRPEVSLPSRIYKQTGITKVVLSISHSREYATAVAIALT